MTSDAMDSAAEAASATVPQKTPLWLLAMITLGGTLAMHIFVPALPLVAHDMGASVSVTQLTLSFYIFGLALAQLVYGPVSDHYGRRPVLIFGMALYTLSSLAALYAPTIDLLIAARFFQALGACAGLVLGRAIVRDTSVGVDAAKNLSLLNLLIMAGPGLSPLAGSALAAAAGWRSIFVALSLFGLVNLGLACFALRESLGRGAHGFRTVLRNYAGLLRSRYFIGYSIGGACATTSLYAFIGASPFIFSVQLQRPLHEVGVFTAILFIGVWLGNLVASRWVGRIAVGRLMIVGNLISCGGAATFLASVVTGHLTLPLTLAPIIVLCFGAGLASPMAMSKALSVERAGAGSASGLYGFVQMAIGALCASLGGLGSSPALATGLVLLAAGIVAQLSFWVARGAAP